MPACGVLGPRARVISQGFRLVMLGIESNSQQHEILPHPARKAPMEDPEIVGRAETKIGKRTSGVDECNRNHLALQRGKLDGLAFLVDESEIGHVLTGLQDSSIAEHPRSRGIENLQSTSG